ncbi:hypothetical protein ACLOJK_011744 [Asimina triloba]
MNRTGEMLLTYVLVVCSCVWRVRGGITLPGHGTVLHFYKNTTCGNDIELYVKRQVKLMYDKDPSVAPALLWLIYADCFVTGCDASILLVGKDSEQTAPQNQGLSPIALDLVNRIKKVLEIRCPRTVSCADILHLAARDAASMAGAPAYPVFTGRRDGYKSSAKQHEMRLAHLIPDSLPCSPACTAPEQTGAHTMGRTRCSYIRGRLYNFQGTGKPDPTMNSTLVSQLRKLCPKDGGSSNDTLVFMNPESGPSFKFRSTYYARLLTHEAVLRIDQQIILNKDMREISEQFATGAPGNPGREDFRQSFALSISRLGNLGILNGDQGEIRKHCAYTNAQYDKLFPN